MAKAKKKLTIEDALVPVSEQPYKVPENWCWTYLLAGAAECLDGFRKPINSTERAKREGDIPYYGATGQVGWIDDYLSDEQLVLLGEDGAPFLDLIKDKAYLIEGKAWVNNHAHILKSFYGEIGNRFLLYYLNNFNYQGFVNGTTRLKLTQASMNTMPFALPPLPEQKRIVEQIERLFSKLDEAKEKAQEVIESFETRRASILHDAFTGKLSLKWRAENKRELSKKVVSLGEITEIKSSKRVYKEDYVDDGIPFFRTTEVVELYEYGSTTPNMFITRKKYEEIKRAKGVPRKGNLLVTSVGTIGKTWIVDDREFYYKDGNLTEVEQCDELDMRFLQYYIMSEEFNNQVIDTVSGSAYNALTIVKFKKIKILIPEIDEQIFISDTLTKVLNKETRAKEAAEQVIDQIELIKKSILAKAFRGELGTNNREEESSVKLLKEIMGE